MEHTGKAPAAHVECERGSARPAKAAAKRVPRNGSLLQWKKECRQLQGQVAQLEERLKRQSADSYGLQVLYDQLVNEIKHHRDMLQLNSFDADKSSLVYTQAWRRFMAGDALDYQTHRHTNSRSRPSLL
ncbi:MULTISPECIES: hypothetical protein [unclassified Janthinobacterium]|uniref:hypothetical protein n=1 Tax=unclassified Janthinobacterium TaxID=2610881 RepID=UPI0027131403|nr:MULTISPECIES: hypothetical protein [unclassified Janthinobacterium]MDO8042266.1 hypothetical protein [Janthinobacterium sp. SUN137]MDO8069280.1 hypothetical protein [Janthinobacterium sp. SUN206]